MPSKISSDTIALIVGTPGDSRGGVVNYPTNLQALKEFVKSNASSVIGISTIRTLKLNSDQESYTGSNLAWENFILGSGAALMRLKNYWGMYPSDNSNQRNLAPWVFMDERETTQGLLGNIMFPDRAIEFHTPYHMLEGIKTGKIEGGLLQMPSFLSFTPREILSMARNAKTSPVEQELKVKLTTEFGDLALNRNYACQTLSKTRRR